MVAYFSAFIIANNEFSLDKKVSFYNSTQIRMDANNNFFENKSFIF